MGKTTSAPPMPDYIGAAKQTAESNLEAARAATAANRVNQVTPWGSLTYSQAPRQFDQAGYDAAMQAYGAQNSTHTLPTQVQKIGGDGRYGGQQTTYVQPQSTTGGKMPNREDFYTGSKDGGWTAEVKLSPEQQALLDQQNKTSLGLGALQDQMMGQVKNSIGNQINYKDLPQVQGMDLSRLPQQGQLSYNNMPQLNGIDQNKLSAQGQLNYSNMPQLGNIDTSKLSPQAKLDYSKLQQAQLNYANLPQVQGVNRDNMPTIQGDYAKTGYNAIMDRLNPQLEAQRKAFDTQMANQGIGVGSEAYNNAWKNQYQSENDARTQAALQGIGIGLNQQQQQAALQNQEFNQRLGMFGSQLQNRQQMANEAQNMYQSQYQNRQQQANEAQNMYNAQFQNRNQSLAEQQAQNANLLANRGQMANEAQNMYQSQYQNRNQSLAEQQAGNAANLANRGQMANEAQNIYNSQLQNRGQSLAEQQALFNSQMANQQQQFGLQTALQDRPLNQLNALRAGSQVQSPTFVNPSQQATTGGVDYNQVAGLQNQYNMGLYNSRVGQQNNLLGTLGTLGGSVLGMFSDERLKTNIERIGTHDTLGIGIYKYEKFGVPEIGVLAQELEQVRPDAVSMHASGFKVIDMGAL